ncbi:MAG: exopolysaccharide biosynthesis polyprenyl glycosylphosphotransferase [Oscillospiraceae bacterium]|nr:exopolysaccharide biosynthesis polyprenyl glycosylphosphotransferase [Oscillospiraceae bacterium]
MKIFVKFRKSIMLLIKALLVTSVTLGFIETWSTNYINTLFSKNGNYVVILSFVVIFVVFASLYGAFNIGIYRLHEVIYSFSLSLIFTDFIMYLELSLIARELIAIPPMLLGLIYQILVVAVISICANIIYYKLYAARKIVAIYGNKRKANLLIRKMSKIKERFSIEERIDINQHSMDEIKSIINNFEAVLICDVDKNIQKELISYCYTLEKRTYLLPDITDIITCSSYEIQISDTPVLMSRNRGLTIEQELIKRIMDIIISSIGLIITSPIMLICAIAIKLNDGGPILFKQNRITKGGKIFNVLKFRSMIVDADKGGAKKAVNNDDRITKVGRIIRACRMDELPQLINILRGDMSVVGPRPERIENVYEYSQKFPEFELRHRVKAGLTGFAQLYGKYNTSPEDKLNMDLFYIETYSVMQDIKLLILTFKVLFMRESTEGFEESANENVKASKSIREREKKNDK